MEKQTVETKTISLKDLWHLFLQRVWIMAIAAVAAIVLMFVYVKITFVPRYQSTATIYILNTESANSQMVNNDFSLALTLVQDCNYILKSHDVLEKVAQKMEADPAFANKDYQPSALKRAISINNPQDSRVLEITVKADSPEEAQAIVNYLCDVGCDSINRAMSGIDEESPIPDDKKQVNGLNEGTLETAPCNTTGVITYLFAGLLAAVAVYVVFLVALLFDDRIRDNESVEKYLNLTVLGDIPDAIEAKKIRKSYYRSSYGYIHAGKTVSKDGSQNSAEGAVKK